MDHVAFLDSSSASASGETDLLLVQLGVRATARRLGVSERTLRRRFERHGIRLCDYLAARRREMTLGLLAGDSPVAAVADRLGFSSSQTFARYVRRGFGTTATGLRHLLRTGSLRGLPHAEASLRDDGPL